MWDLGALGYSMSSGCGVSELSDHLSPSFVKFSKELVGLYPWFSSL